MSIHTFKPRTAAGFTLIELLVVIAIIALLASLTIGAFSYATTAAGRNRTSATQAAVMAGLERYNADFGEYPTPSAPDATAIFNNISYRAGSAEMLYQALSGDGTSAIQLASGGGRGSDGRIDDDEAPNIKLPDMPKEIWLLVNNRYYIVDGFRKPFQYSKGGQADSINPTYDLWSFCQDEENTTSVSASMKTNPQISAKWITNW
jgi:prepilin-type N-terminal cleavage/methylation domain-containing protein